MGETKKISIFKDLSEEEQALISKTCSKSLILIVDYSTKDDMEFLIIQKCNKYGIELEIENKKGNSIKQIKFDGESGYWLEGKRYVSLELEYVDSGIESFEIILKNKGDNLFFDLTLELLEYDIRKDSFESWYMAVGKDVQYAPSSEMLLGIVAKVSDGWKFYPRFEGVKKNAQS